MRKYYTVFSYKIIFLLILLTQSFVIQAQTTASPQTANIPSPLHQCWDLDVEGINKTKIASDKANQIFLAYQNGIVGAINLLDGNQNWKTELGGDVGSIIYKDGFLYVVSLNQTDNSIAVRALSAETGLTKWQRSLSIGNRPDSGNSRLSLIQIGDFLFFVTAGGDLYKIAKETGEELEKVSFGENVTTYIKSFDQKIAFGSDRKKVIIYSVTDQTTTTLPLSEIPTVIYLEPERIITGDVFGKLTSLKIRTNKKEWQTRVGAEVSDVTETKEGLAVSSNDNFIYLISPKNGGKIWKRRFAGRTASAVSPAPISPTPGLTTGNSESILAVVNLNGDAAALLDSRSGKIINQIKLPGTAFFTGEPLFVNQSLIFTTNTGLTMYSSDTKCAEKERPEDNSGL